MTALRLNIRNVLRVLHCLLLRLVTLQLDCGKDRRVVHAAGLLYQVHDGRLLIPACASNQQKKRTLIRSHFREIGRSVLPTMLLERDANSVLADLRETARTTFHFPILVILSILKGVKKRYRALQRGNLPCGNGVETVIAESTTPNTIPSVRPFLRVMFNFRQRNRDQTAYAPPQLQLTSFVNLPGHKDTTMRDPPESVYTILAWCQTVVWGVAHSSACI